MPAAELNTAPGRPGRRIVIAGGGTGGHLFPGIAVAQAFQAIHADNRVLFINAGRPLDIQVLSRSRWKYRTIPIEGIKGRALWRQLGAVIMIPKAIWKSLQALKAFRPHLVLGVGGYAAGPVVTAAWWLGIASALHEQNQLPGVTNRILGRMVDHNFLSFEDSAGRFNRHKTTISGNPVRDEILIPAGQTAMHDEKRFSILVVGGSQGAHAINQAVIDALQRLKSLEGLRIVHQTGSEDESWVAEAYQKAGIRATVRAFFDDMAGEYQKADLILCRAGATTVAEITAMGKAALFVPFPHAADDHQTRNAQALVAAGAAEMITQKDLTADLLADKLLDYAQDRPLLARMAANARTLGKPEAALTIVNELYRLLDMPQIVRRRYYQREERKEREE
jgi:UDP-N-acetylglucosamine--N-acetylmuramyl-(pentapeptide) pyrophosphoryl-undecaprenol N-acetylglucosamine transferase